jgi:tripartite-type tricarboxylate transporter receptor subunit TctC
MRIQRRRLAASFGLSALLALPGLAPAQDKQLKILVGYAPGGAADTVARAVGDGLRESGYTVIVENKPGAGGRLATEAVVNGTADGSTLLFTPLGNLTLYPHVFKGLRYDPLKDLVGVGTSNSMSFALAVGASSPAKNLQEFLALARKDSKMAAFGTPGAGTAMHFLGAMLGKQAGVPLTHVPYKGGSAALTDAIGGVLPAVITTTPNLLPMHRAGKIRILAISEAEPNAALSGVPTFKSAGFPELQVEESFAYFAKAGTSAPVIAQLNQAITKAVNSPQVRATLEKAEFTPQTMSPDALNQRVRSGHASWARAVQSTGYTPEE